MNKNGTLIKIWDIEPTCPSYSVTPVGAGNTYRSGGLETKMSFAETTCLLTLFAQSSTCLMSFDVMQGGKLSKKSIALLSQCILLSLPAKSFFIFFLRGWQRRIFPPSEPIMTQDSASAIEVPPTIGDEAAILVSNVNSGLHAKVTPRT